MKHEKKPMHDTVMHLNVDNGSGNGFVFESYDSGGLFWAMDQSMAFFLLPEQVKRE